MPVSSEGSGDQQVLQPVVMISMFVEAFGWAFPAAILSGPCRVPGSEIVEQGPGATVQSGRLKRAMQVLPVVEVTIHRPHDAVQHIARAVTVGVVVSDLPSVPLATKVQDVLQDDAAEVLRGPRLQGSDALGKAPTVGSVISVPDPLRDLREPLLQVFGSVPNLQPTVKEALHLSLIHI